MSRTICRKKSESKSDSLSDNTGVHFRINLGHRLRRDPGIGGCGEMELHFADESPWIRCEGELKHFDPGLRTGEGGLGLVRRLSTRDEDDLVQAEVHSGTVGNCEMPEGHGVKCSSKQTELTYLDIVVHIGRGKKSNIFPLLCFDL